MVASPAGVAQQCNRLWVEAQSVVGGGSFLFIPEVAPSPADAANVLMVGEGNYISWIVGMTNFLFPVQSGLNR